MRLEDATPSTPNDPDPDPGSTRGVVLEGMVEAAASSEVGEGLVQAPEGVRGLRGAVWSNGVSTPFLAFLKGENRLRRRGGEHGGIGSVLFTSDLPSHSARCHRQCYF